MADRNLSRNDILPGVDLYPRSEEAAHREVHGTWIAFLTAAALIGMGVVVIATHFNPIALAGLVILIVALIAGMVGNHAARTHRVPANLTLTARVKSELLTEINATGVHVESDRGVVTLSGTVPYPDFREAASQIARRAGATQVNNRIEVEARVPQSGDDYLKGVPGVTTPEGAPEAAPVVSLEQSIYDALAVDTRVNVHLIEIENDLGMVTLSGRQGTVEAQEAAIEIAAHQPGVLGISNEIEVKPEI